MENQKTHSKALESLNKSLAPVAFLVGHSVTLADFAVWGALKGVKILSCYFLLFFLRALLKMIIIDLIFM